MFDYFSSPMRWCETRMGDIFIYSSYIIEFWNSITSLFFCLSGIYGYYMHYNMKLDNVPWFYLFSIGITSAIFHATLSFIGQFLDELSIILLITYCLRVYYKINYSIYIFISFILSCISWFHPSVSPPILLVCGFFLILSTYQSVNNNEVDYLWYASMKIGILGIITWLVDFICIINTHMLWHILMSISSYYIILFVIKENKRELVVKGYYLPYLEYRLKVIK
jgi:alkaline ceramidase